VLRATGSVRRVHKPSQGADYLVVLLAAVVQATEGSTVLALDAGVHLPQPQAHALLSVYVYWASYMQQRCLRSDSQSHARGSWQGQAWPAGLTACRSYLQD
jgi:hypothetical protein